MRVIDLNTIEYAGIVCVLVLMLSIQRALASEAMHSLPSQYQAMSDDDRIDEVVESKLRSMYDAESSPGFHGRCVVTSKTDKFTDKASHSLWCVNVGDYVKNYGLDVSTLLHSSSLMVSCDAIFLRPRARPMYKFGERTSVRYRFDQQKFVGQDWSLGFEGESAFSSITDAELSEFLRNVMSSSLLIFDVGGGEGQIEFGKKSRNAVEDIARRCGVEVR